MCLFALPLKSDTLPRIPRVAAGIRIAVRDPSFGSLPPAKGSFAGRSLLVSSYRYILAFRSIVAPYAITRCAVSDRVIRHARIRGVSSSPRRRGRDEGPEGGPWTHRKCSLNIPVKSLICVRRDDSSRADALTGNLSLISLIRSILLRS